MSAPSAAPWPSLVIHWVAVTSVGVSYGVTRDTLGGWLMAGGTSLSTACYAWLYIVARRTIVAQLSHISDLEGDVGHLKRYRDALVAATKRPR